MSEHLHIERISALLDEPWADLEADRHLEGCETCRAEFERLSRMRMAFSALGELEPPSEEWSRIEATLDRRLPDSGIVPFGPRGIAAKLMTSGPLQAAAAVALFAGGIFAGLQFTGGGPGGDPVAAVPSVIPVSGEDRELYDVMSDLESLQTPLRQVGADDPSASAEAGFDPLEVAQMAARLDGIIRALQDRLDESPGDPFASGYLMRAVEQRARLAALLEQSARNSSVVEW
ncbi:MAG: hypothetical protein R3195_04810 [Gemmatimonadota bacterium]|nr:hypothetical protein [Gemmatimonadota bacterium]